MIYQLIGKLQDLPAFNLVERETTLEIIEMLLHEIHKLEDRVEKLEKSPLANGVSK